MPSKSGVILCRDGWPRHDKLTPEWIFSALVQIEGGSNVIVLAEHGAPYMIHYGDSTCNTC